MALFHTKASDLSLLARAMKKQMNIRTLTLDFDRDGSERREDNKSSRVRTQRRRAMNLLMRAVQRCECVQQLLVWGPSQNYEFFDEEGWRALCDVVQHTSLEVLHVMYCGLGDNEAKQLATSLTNNTTLRGLGLYWNRIGEDGVRALSDVLQSNNTMKGLDLIFNNYSESTGDRVRHELKHITGLYV